MLHIFPAWTPEVIDKDSAGALNKMELSLCVCVCFFFVSRECVNPTRTLCSDLRDPGPELPNSQWHVNKLAVYSRVPWVEDEEVTSCVVWVGWGWIKRYQWSKYSLLFLWFYYTIFFPVDLNRGLRLSQKSRLVRCSDSRCTCHKGIIVFLFFVATVLCVRACDWWQSSNANLELPVFWFRKAFFTSFFVVFDVIC